MKLVAFTVSLLQRRSRVALASLALAAALLVIVGAAMSDYDAIAFGVLFAGFVAAACLAGVSFGASFAFEKNNSRDNQLT